VHRDGSTVQRIDHLPEERDLVSEVDLRDLNQPYRLVMHTGGKNTLQYSREKTQGGGPPKGGEKIVRGEKPQGML